MTHDQHTNQVFKINSLLNFRIVHGQWQISWFWGNMEFSGQKNVWHWYAYQCQRNSKFLVLSWIMPDFHNYWQLWSRAIWDTPISINVALGFGHWNTEYNAMLCLSEHQTMAFKDKSTIPEATFIEIGVYVQVQ